MSNEKDQYFVAVKLFLENDQGQLLLTKDRFGDWDLPGGRLKTDDFAVALEKVADRKTKEELGEEVKINLGEPKVFLRHERDEILSSGQREKRRIFAVGYASKYLGGEIHLGKNHEKYEWISKDSDFDKYLTGGWLQGVKDYLSLN